MKGTYVHLLIQFEQECTQPYYVDKVRLRQIIKCMPIEMPIYLPVKKIAKLFLIN